MADTNKNLKIWMNGRFVAWDKAQIHILTHSLHYGSGVFEGIRFYETAKGPAIFRLKEHVDRLFYSASWLKMKLKYTKKQVCEAIIKLVKLNKLKNGYIRPLIYYGAKIGLNPAGGEVNMAIISLPWGKYLAADSAKAKISNFMRIHPKSTISDAKITGTYYNSILASLDVYNQGYDEAILLDFKGNLAEGPGENIFIVKRGVLLTPGKGKILPGITRSSLMQIAKELGIKAQQKTISKKTLLSADEAFFSGTAAEITPIRSINDHKIGKTEIGPVTQKIKELYMKVTHGEVSKYHKWLTFIQ